METFKQLEDIYREYWHDVKSVVVVPDTERAKVYVDDIRKDLEIEAILDNDEAKDGTEYDKIPIYYAPAYLAQRKSTKFLVSRYYTEIAEQLKQNGYKENIDFIDMHKFVSLWYWHHRKEIHLQDLHTAITTYCSLNCQNCNMFMNYYPREKKKNYSFQEFQEDFNALFQNVDFCHRVTLLGGEPLLHRELPVMIEWLNDNYSSRIALIKIITNGTIIPSEELIDSIKKSRIKVNVAISNYGVDRKYEMKVNTLIELLEEKKIKYIVNKEMEWKDFFFPQKKQQVVYSTEREHMLSCNPIFRGLNNKRFYYCHVAWSAVEAGLLAENPGDYIDLNNKMEETERKELLLHDLGFVKNGYVSLCKYCGGCGEDNKYLIKAGVQDKMISGNKL